jgi:hypothetical protein
VIGAYVAAIRSHLGSARFDAAVRLIRWAKELAAEKEKIGATARESLGLDGDYAESVVQLTAWLEAPKVEALHVDLALSAMRRLPSLAGGSDPALLATARAIVRRLEQS